MIAPIAEDYHYTLALFPLVVGAVAVWERRGRGDAGSRWRHCAGGRAARGAVALQRAERGRLTPCSYYPRVYGALLLWGLLRRPALARPGTRDGRPAGRRPCLTEADRLQYDRPCE